VDNACYGVYLDVDSSQHHITQNRFSNVDTEIEDLSTASLISNNIPLGGTTTLNCGGARRRSVEKSTPQADAEPQSADFGGF